MSHLKDKIVLITGASSGIGAACAKQFAEQGANVILAARRLERIQSLANELEQQYGIKALAQPLDVRDRETVDALLPSLDPAWQSIDILVNNAGLALGSELMQESDIDNWDAMIDTNLKGLLYVTRAILPSMVKRSSGHIINIGSIAGHETYPRGNVYSATKHAVTALSQSLRLDLLGTGLRVSNISPGAVDTEFSLVRWQDEDRAKKFYELFTPLQANDIADGVLFAASRPEHVNISEVIIMPTDQASLNHLHTKSDNNKVKSVFDQK